MTWNQNPQTNSFRAVAESQNSFKTVLIAQTHGHKPTATWAFYQRVILTGFLCVPLAFSLSCQPVTAAGEIEVSIDRNNLILIDAPSTSCSARFSAPSRRDDKTSVSVTLPRFTLSPKVTGSVRIIFVRFTFTGGGLSAPLQYTLAGAALETVMSGAAVDAGIVLPPPVAATYTNTSICEDAIGGIGIDKTKTASGSGEIFVRGLLGTDGQLGGKIPFTWSYTP